MADASRPRVSDTLPRSGRVNEVCREWVVHEDEALAYQLQKQEVEQHYENNKERNARVREDFPKAKEEQEKEIVEAAEKYRQMIRQQEKVDSNYARRVAAKLEREEFEKRRRAEIHDLEVARMMQVCEITRNPCRPNGESDDEHLAAVKVLPVATPDVNRVGLPFLENVNFEPEAVSGRLQANVAVTHNLRNLRLKDDNYSNNDADSKNGSVEEKYLKTCIRKDSGSNCATTSSTVHNQGTHTIRTPTLAVALPPDVNEIICDADLQEEANRRLQEEKDAELARMLQKQEEEILNEELGRDRMVAIEAQDKELAKLLYEKEKAKLKRAKERARQRALLKKQQQLQSPFQQQQLQTQDENTSPSIENSITKMQSTSTPVGTIPFTLQQLERGSYTNESLGRSEEMVEHVGDQSDESSFSASSLTSSRIAGPSIVNVAMHIDPTYLSQQSACTPNSLMFQDGDTTVPPYMPIQGQRRNSPFIDKKQKKSKSKDGCKQQ